MMTTADLTQFFPYAWAFHLARALVTFFFTQAILRNKRSAALNAIIIVLPSIIYSYFSLMLPIKSIIGEFFTVIIYYVMQFLIINAIFQGTVISKVITVIFSLVSYLTGGFIWALTASALLDAPSLLIASDKIPVWYLASCSLFVLAFSLFISIFLKFILSKKNNPLSRLKNKYALFLTFPLLHIASLYLSITPFHLLFHGSMSNSLNEVYDSYLRVVLFLYCFTTILDLFIPSIIDKMDKTEQRDLDMQKQIMKNQIDYRQMEMFRDEKEKVNKIRHDFLNIINTARGFIEIGNTEKALSILHRTGDDLTGIANFTLCSNETINTVIYIKQQQAQSDGIRLITDISESFAVKTDDYDLCRILNNIIDNCLNAVRELESERICKININIEPDIIEIKSENGFAAGKKVKKRGKELNGNGIIIIENILKKYNGKYSYSAADGLWKTETTLENVSPDSAPPPAFSERFQGKKNFLRS